MNEVHKLVRQMRDYLSGAAPLAAVDTLAADYAGLCGDASARLDTCAAMLAKGSDYQALQLAESEPALLDLLAALSFGEARQWVEFCASRGLAFPPPFDQRAVDTLDTLYRRGVPANHPLYRDYRAAVTSRDDAKAIAVIRTITRLNPGDANAKSELLRLENKTFQTLKQRLRAAIETSDVGTTIATLDELHRIPAARDLPGTPDYETGLAIRRAADARVAAEDAALAAATLPSARSRGDWREAAVLLGRVDSLKGEHGFSLSAEDERECGDVRAWVESERAEAERTMQFEAAVSRLGQLSGEAESLLRVGTPLTQARAAELLLDLERAWKEIEAFGRPVSDDVLRLARSAAASVRAESRRMQRARVLKTVVGAIAAVVVIGLAGWWVWRGQQSGDFQSQLSQLQTAGALDAAERLAGTIRAEHASLSARPQLNAQLEQTEAWARDIRRRLADAETSVSAVESDASGKFQSGDAQAFIGHIEAVPPLITNLPQPLRPPLDARLTTARTAFESWIASQRDTVAQSAEAELAKMEAMTQEQLRIDLPSEALTATLGAMDPLIRAFDVRTRPSVPALELPAAMATRFSAVRQKTSLIRAELDELARKREALSKAGTLDDYRAALATLSQSQLTQSPEVAAAGKLAAQFPTEDSLMAALLLPDDPVQWSAIKQETGEPWKPKDVIKAELDRLIALRDDPYVSNIYEATLKPSTGEKRTVYSEGEIRPPTVSGDASTIETSTWSGKFHDPKSQVAMVRFAERTFTLTKLPKGRSGDELASTGASPAAQAFRELELQRMTDGDGAIYEQSLLPKIRIVAQNKKAPVLFRAYLVQELAKIMEIRPNAWGLPYCRSLRADLEELRSTTADSPLRSSDWLASGDQKAKREAALKPLIERFSTRLYDAEARACRAVLATTRKAGFKLGGYVDASGKPKLLGEAQAGFTLWTLDTQGNLIRLTAKPAHLLAPVFFIPIQPTELLSEARKAYGGEIPSGVLDSIPLITEKP